MVLGTGRGAQVVVLHGMGLTVLGTRVRRQMTTGGTVVLALYEILCEAIGGHARVFMINF